MGTRSGREPISRSTTSREVAAQDASHRESMVRSYLHRWAEAAGAQMLVVDPAAADDALIDAMAGRGVHVTWARTTTEALVEFGRLSPHAVVVVPDAPGLPAEDFVVAVKEHPGAYVVAAVDDAETDDVGSLMLAGASAVVTRPYTADDLWDLLSQAPRALDDHAHLVCGPIELDASAYRVLLNGERIEDLPLKEFELLRTLMIKAPGVVADDDLRTALWGSEANRPSGNTIAMHVTRLRHRLDGVATVRRIRGRGYSLEFG